MAPRKFGISLLKILESQPTRMSGYILMVHMSQELDFSKSAFGINPVIKCIPNLLDSHLFTSLRIQSRALHTEQPTHYMSSTVSSQSPVLSMDATWYFSLWLDEKTNESSQIFKGPSHVHLAHDFWNQGDIHGCSAPKLRGHSEVVQPKLSKLHEKGWARLWSFTRMCRKLKSVNPDICWT